VLSMGRYAPTEERRGSGDETSVKCAKARKSSYMTDTSLLTAALHLDELAVMRDGNLLGRLIETYVLAQIRPELELAGFTPRLYHLREKNGRHEIDLIAELSGGDQRSAGSC
jgi:predicted AAA+ superfamily ATPase